MSHANLGKARRQGQITCGQCLVPCTSGSENSAGVRCCFDLIPRTPNMSQPLNWYGIERSVPIDSSASCFVTMMVLGLGVSVGDISLINRMVEHK